MSSSNGFGVKIASQASGGMFAGSIDRLKYVLSPVPMELWEQATGVVRPEGNPTVSQYTRRQARATGITGMRQFRFMS